MNPGETDSFAAATSLGSGSSEAAMLEASNAHERGQTPDELLRRRDCAALNDYLRRLEQKRVVFVGALPRLHDASASR